jgi:hypothetical protein
VKCLYLEDGRFVDETLLVNALDLLQFFEKVVIIRGIFVINISQMLLN